MPQATGQLIAYSRDPKKYRLAEYAQYIPTKKTVGLYCRLDPDQPVRVVADADAAWADGDERPKANNNNIKFDFVEFSVERKDYPYTIGWMAVENASWEVLAAHANMAQNQCMTARTQRAITLLETASTWGNNTADANVLNGGAGHWDTGSSDPTDPNYLAIKKGIDEATRRIVLLTNGMVEQDDLMLIVSPGGALKMSQTPEIYDYLAQSPYALAQVKGREPGQNSRWGLPDTLYGMKIVVETAVRVTERPKASGVAASITSTPPKRQFIKSDDSALIVSRPGGLDGTYGSPSFSTLQIYYYGSELEVEAFDDTKNRRTEGHVVENVKEIIAAPASGFLITDILS